MAERIVVAVTVMQVRGEWVAEAEGGGRCQTGYSKDRGPSGRNAACAMAISALASNVSAQGFDLPEGGQ